MIQNNAFYFTGDMGDVVAGLPSVRALGGGDIFIGPPGKDQARESLKGKRFDAIKPLLRAQPYVYGVSWTDEKEMFNYSHDLSTFRHDWIAEESLLDWQARHLGVTASTDPWLQCMRSHISSGRTVVARSMRYRNPGFPWHAIMQKYRNCIFVGTPEEHKSFTREISSAVEYVPTENLLQLAEVIAGSHLFVGNQSCPFWIAAGLGVNLIQESWPQSPNSQIRRPNARYLIRGHMTI